MKKFGLSVFGPLFVLWIAACSVGAGNAYKATIGDHATFQKGVTVTGGVTADSLVVSGTTASSGAQTFAANVTLDDGTGASPSLILKDATDQTATFSKVDAGNITLTPGSTTESLQVLTGNLRVGNGTAGQTINGEDGYVEGLLENDGGAYLDGGAVIGSGTTLSKVALYNLAFAGDTSKTATVTAVTGSYMAFASFLTSSADPGKIVCSITDTTLTATVASATTGTLSVLVVYTP